MPATAVTAIEWGSIFNPGATFLDYINYLEKACYFSDQPTDWVTPALTNVIKGVRLEGEDKSRFPNFIDSSIAVSMLKHENRNPEFPQLAYLAFLFFHPGTF